MISYCENREFSEYARALYAGVAGGTVTMADLVRLIISLYEKEVGCLARDEDNPAYFSMDTVYSICGYFAFALLKKGLLDRRWTYQDGVFSQNGQTLAMEEICRMAAAAAGRAGGDDHGAENYFDRMKDFDPEKEAFRLAVLDHCTEENIFAALIMAQDMEDNGWSSPEDLKESQRFFPERLTPDKLAGIIDAETFSLYCYDFLEKADPRERAEADWARDRIGKAGTTGEALLAALEFEFRIQSIMIFPYYAYLLLTGQPEGFPVP